MILLIKQDELTKYTPLSGNIDLSKLVPAFRTAQITVIKDILGDELLDKLLNDLTNDTLTGDYETIYNLYIKNMLIHLATSYYLTTGPYQIDNRGVFKHKSDNVENVNKEEIDYLSKQQYKYYTYYKRSFYKAIDKLDIPEYHENRPYKNVFKIGGWILDNKKC